MKEEGCVLWEQAKVLGEARHLEIHGTCPVDTFCEGTQCIYLASKEILTDIEQLVDLRNELAILKMRNDLQKLTNKKPC